jgi:hypothetical protein
VIGLPQGRLRGKTQPNLEVLAMRRLTLTLLLSLPLACAHGGFSEKTGWAPLPAGADADPKAQQMIDEMWTAMGVLPAYQKYGELRWTWNFSENGALKKSENFFWNRFQHRMLWEENSAEGDLIAVRADLENHHGKAYHANRRLGGNQVGNNAGTARRESSSINASFQPLPSSDFPHLEEAAYRSYQQATFWLTGPLNLRDKGVHVKAEDNMKGPDGEPYAVLHVTFDEGAIPALKAGDELWWLVDTVSHLPRWMLWKQGGHEGQSAWSQEDWKDVGGGLKLPTLHKQWSTTIQIQFANTQLNPQPDDDQYSFVK